MHFDSHLLRQCWFLVGPTGVGKSETSLLLAEQLQAEIVALDSMSLYRGMDIGTAKPSPAMQQRLPHHLIDVIDPHEEFSVADYVAAAEAVCQDIVQRGSTPLFVGGTGLYLRAVLRGVFQGPPADWDLRRRLEQESTTGSPETLHQRLAAVDPQTAERLHPNDLRRVIRALEVFHLTGQPLSAQQTEQPLHPEQRPQHVYWLSPPRAWLHERINTRVLKMIKAGLVDEVRGLLAAEKPMSRTARQALGYKEIIDHLEKRTTLEEAIDTIQRRTRQFAKRQHTWFRNLEECQPVELTGDETAAEIVSQLLPLM